MQNHLSAFVWRNKMADMVSRSVPCLESRKPWLVSSPLNDRLRWLFPDPAARKLRPAKASAPRLPRQLHCCYCWPCGRRARPPAYLARFLFRRTRSGVLAPCLAAEMHAPPRVKWVMRLAVTRSLWHPPRLFVPTRAFTYRKCGTSDSRE